jgi:EAL domain-containing protein (putative c-di-GMP-specific phosphodiesterase class I)
MPGKATTMQGSEHAVPVAIVVDDEPDIREYVASVAQEAGFEIKTAGSGSELLSILAEPFPHIIVLDLNMANSDGVQVMRELAVRRVSSKIVIFSGTDLRIIEASSEIARQHGLAIGAILQKPVRKAELLRVLQRLNQESAPFSWATLQACLAGKLLTLHYQPKIAVPSFEVVGCEALLRCVDPVGRAIPPETVVSVAESGGIIDEVTEWVFREAIAQRQRWSAQGLEMDVSVNLSARSTFNQDLPELFAAICAENGVPTGAVTIELTESSVMDDRLLAMETMVRLRLKGFRLSIDDFGTGYSSLLRLKQLPFTELKVDKSFVIGLHDSRDHAVIVRAIIQLARNLEMRSVVEGVEDEKALDFVAGLGCNEAQGYFIARPMAGPELSGFTKTWQWRQDSLRQKGNAAGLSAQDEVRDRRS